MMFILTTRIYISMAKSWLSISDKITIRLGCGDLKSRFEMTLPELLEEYKQKRTEFYDFRDNVYFKSLNEKDEVKLKRLSKEYDELREEVTDIACFIAEKLLK